MPVETTVVPEDPQGSQPVPSRHDAAMQLMKDQPLQQQEAPPAPDPAQQPADPAPGAQNPPAPAQPDAQGGQPVAQLAAPTTDPAPAADPEQQVPPASQDLAPQWAELSRHRATLDRDQGQFTQRVKGIEQRERELEERATGVTDLQQLIKQDPAAALQALGTDFTTVARHFIDNPPATQENQDFSRLQREIKQVSDKTQAIDQARQAEAEAAKLRTREDEVRHVLDKSDNLAVSRFHGQDAINLALQVQDAHEAQQGVRPTIDQVLEQVEAYYVDQASRLTQLPKVQQTLGTPPGPQPSPAAPTAAAIVAQPQQGQPQTDPAQPVVAGQQPPEQAPIPQQGQQEQPTGSPPTLSNDLVANNSPRVSRVPTDAERRSAAHKILEQSQQQS